MPAKALWLLHIPDIIAMLESFDVPVVDRAVIEHLFGLRRRRAIQLPHRFGGYQAGRTYPGRPADIDRTSPAPGRRARNFRWKAAAKNDWTRLSINSTGSTSPECENPRCL